MQVLTPGAVEPSLLSFFNSRLTKRICKDNDFVSEWAPSIEQAVETGEVYSQGFRFCRSPTTTTSVSGIGPGAADYRSAVLFGDRYLLRRVPGQPNRSDPLAGGRTGAGGANVWTHDLLRQLLPGADGPFTALPQGASFRVSIRRVIRAGTHRGVPLEDLGVSPDQLHNMTKNDLLNDNADLIAKATQMLAAIPRVSLTASIGPVTAGKRTITVTTERMDRVDIDVDGRPRATIESATGRQRWTSPTPVPAMTYLFGIKSDVLRAVVHLAT